MKEFENLIFTSLEKEKLKLALQTSNTIFKLDLIINTIISTTENVDNIL